ncbi:MAG: DUF433 domain-containing protein [Chloroflexi bacterium]|nr:DUF433 domain-containing protein [Chloroflexota bacterium]
MRTEELIERYVEEDPRRPGPAEARLRASSVPVWILVAQLDAANGDPARLAGDYHLPREAVEAALAYYRRHKRPIDARIALNAA